MRILQVNKFLYRRGGAEAYMEDVAALQVAAGHQVAFFAMEHEENQPSRYSKHFPAQVDFEPVPAGVASKVRGVGRMFWSTSAARGIGAVLDDFRPDVVHLHNIYHQLSPSILRPMKRRRVPVVMTLHDFSLACPTYNFLSHGKVCEACIGGHFLQAVKKRCESGSLAASAVSAAELAVHTKLDAYGPVDLFICPSAFMVQKMTEAKVHPTRLRRLNHFVHIDRPAKTQPGQGILYVGRLSPEKAVDVLIRAVGELHTTATLDIVGDGPDRAALTSLATELAPGRVRFHGRVASDEVARYLRDAAICVVPSRWYENQPLVVLEAYTAGTAVVGSRLGGISELISPGQTGELFTSGSVRELAAALTRLLADPEGCYRMGQRGREWVESTFTPKAHLAELDNLYAEAAALSSARA